MRINHTETSTSPRSRHTTYITVLSTYITIVGTVVGLLFTWSQLRIAQNEEVRARRSEPLAYTLEAVDTHYQYSIQTGSTVAEISAPSLRLRLTHGSLHAITAICFDGTAFHQIAPLPFQDDWEDCTVDITMPPQAVIADAAFIYDYFFLFLEPVEGQNQLDLICNTICLDTQEVQSSVYHPVSLVQLDFLSDGPQREMLSVYATLYQKLSDLGMLPG